MPPQANGGPLLRWALSLSTLLAIPASAQNAERIWGRVHTTEGRVLAGFLRWNRTGANWADVLRGLKELPEENYFAWLEAYDREPATRTLDFRGYRITWKEVDPEFPMEVRTGVRFGHLDSLVALDGARARLTLRSGARLELEPRGRDRGGSAPKLHVEAPGQEEIGVDWDELERVVFSAPPPAAFPEARRLFGTAEDRSGNRFTGHLAWDRDEILESDVLDGRLTRRPTDRRIAFARIRSLTRVRRGVRVELSDGGTLELEGTNDVGRGNRGVRVADPSLGVVVVPWERLRAVRFHRPGEEAAETGGRPRERGGFDGGRALVGTVVARGGEEIRGELRWDAEEAGDWEFLSGEAEGVEYEIEFRFVRRIELGAEDGTAAVLADGRVIEGIRDATSDGKGVMVASEDRSGTRNGGSEWRLIPWADVREVRFDPDPATPGGRERP